MVLPFNKIINKHKKIIFITSLLGLLGLFLWVFYFQQSSIRETLIMEHMDPHANISQEPDPPKETKTKGLYLKSNHTEDIQNYVVQTVGNALKISQNNQIRGPPGEKGQKGDDGMNGGLYISKGPLRSAKYNSMVVERTYGTGVGAKAFLTGQSFLPQQTWTLGTDNKLCSGYNENECLTMAEDGSVYMLPKPMATAWVHSRSTGQLQNKFRIGGKINCLTAKKVGSIQAHNKIPTNGQPPQGRSTPLSNALVLESSSCSGDLGQAWAFH